MRCFGLIGQSLSHSFSADYFGSRFAREKITNASYRLFPMPDLTGFRAFVESEDSLCGLNVTIPYKEAIIPFLDHLSDEAKAVGAVNTIAIDRKGPHISLTGHNTDTYGFSAALTPLLQPHHTRALVLGTGGAAKAVKYVLAQKGIEAASVSRTEGPGVYASYDALTPGDIAGFPIIINTSPVGMSPNIHHAPPIPYEAISARHLVFDLIYNPDRTLFLSKAAQQGAITENGLKMLYLQADRAWEIWSTLKM
ncbi:MAG: shikimate dehydrogenase [Bacteroidales bacterium]